MSKRKRFVVTSVCLTAGLLAIANLSSLATRYFGIGFLSLLAAVLTIWSLREGLDSLVEWLVVPILPFFFVLAVALFYFLLPPNLFTLVIVLTLFVFGMYVLLLTENIFSVASIRTIALFRAASSVAFLLTLATGFFLFDVVFSFLGPAWLNALLVFAICLFLNYHSLWSVNLEKKFDRKTFIFSVILALILGQFAYAISFWPVSVALASLFLTASSYVFLGLFQAEFSGRFFKKTIREYLIVGVGVLITLLLTTRWG